MTEAYKLTANDFRKYLKGSFEVYLEDPHPIDVVLIEVDDLTPPYEGPVEDRPPGIPATLRTDPYSMTMRGPLDVTLGQGHYKLTHVELGELILFMVPIAEDERGRYYQIIFN